MDIATRTYISNLGGYRSVAKRLKKKPQTVHTAMQSGELPAAWYDALCGLAKELDKPEPDRALFSFLALEAA